jgi:C-terminal processing protease CtpA/Prc
MRRALALALGVIAGGSLPAQELDRQMVDRGHRMLAQVKADLLEFYYDSTFGGLDLEASYRRADSSLDAATTPQQLLGIIAQFVLDLKDSHTTFLPPGRAATVEYGWGWILIGDSCYVAWVKEGSDAAQKGLAVGQQILAVDGMQLTRQTDHIVGYLYYALNPRPGMRLMVRALDGTPREITVLAKITSRPQIVDYTSFQHISALIEESEQRRLIRRHFTRSFGDTALVWRFRSFDYGDQRIDEIMGAARNHRSLIIDLRDNGGGSVDTELRLLGHFFDRETRVLTERQRGESRPRLVQPRGKEPYRGNVFILVNSKSASAAEVTARVLQLEGKATIIGDRSAGALMTSIRRSHAVGFGRRLPYGLAVTIQDVIMADSNRIENVGVMPEFIVLPTGADLAERRDPVMAKALALAGIRMDPKDAAAVFRTR